MGYFANRYNTDTGMAKVLSYDLIHCVALEVCGVNHPQLQAQQILAQ